MRKSNGLIIGDYLKNPPLSPRTSEEEVEKPKQGKGREGEAEHGALDLTEPLWALSLCTRKSLPMAPEKYL